MKKITLTIKEPLASVDFLKSIGYSEENEVLGETIFGQWKDQIVPSIYFRQNEYYRLDFNSAMQGMFLGFISQKEKITFYMEFHDNPFVRYNKREEDHFSILLTIQRNDLTRFEINDKLHFMAVKAKNSYKFMSGMRGAPVGGLITGLLFRGAFNLAAKAEDDLIEKEGTQFSLYFNELGTEKCLNIIVESFYVKPFEEILKLHWNKTSPPSPKKEKEKEGCFIATACYDDYNHPIVIQLRYFRDSYLRSKNWGVKFISIYYKYSPCLANFIKTNKVLKLWSKLFIVKPLYYISKLITKKSI